MDHTADVQLHAWGTDLKEAFENVGMAMFGYMTDIETVDMTLQTNIEAEGDDIEGLLFHFLDEWLFIFSADDFFIPRNFLVSNNFLVLKEICSFMETGINLLLTSNERMICWVFILQYFS